jgi:hypothetical protein
MRSVIDSLYSSTERQKQQLLLSLSQQPTTHSVVHTSTVLARKTLKPTLYHHRSHQYILLSPRRSKIYACTV